MSTTSIGSAWAGLQRETSTVTSAEASASEKSGGSSLLRRKLKAAVFAVQFANRRQRRLPGGQRRHSVAYGALLEHQEAAKEAKKRHSFVTRLGSLDSMVSSRAQHFFEHQYEKLGRWIGKRPRLSMLIGTLVLLSGLPGSFLLKGEANVLWISFDTRMYENFAIQDNHFYTDYEHAVHLYDGFHHPPNVNVMVFSPKLAVDAVPVLSKVG